jgi:tripartite-type tricarboxylate transporter receptor subunit TctC
MLPQCVTFAELLPCDVSRKPHMNPGRRKFLHFVASFAALPFAARQSWAQAYPQHPAIIIVGFPPGGAADLPARVAAQWLSEHLGQQFIVENRPGAGSKLATEALVRAPPDGYTLLLLNPSIAINATFEENYTAQRNIQPVAGMIRLANVIVVNRDLPIRSVPDLIAYAKANPGKLSMASSGHGTAIHLAGEMFKLQAGIEMVHVPYRGSPPALTDLIAGRVQVMFDTIPTSIEHIRAGALRGLAVTSLSRAAVLPDLPPVADYLPGFEASVFFGLGAPKATPVEIVTRLNGEINMALSQPEITSPFSELGASITPGSPAEFGKLIADETEKWAKVIKSANIKPE